VVGNVSLKKVAIVLLHPPAHMIGREPQNVDFVLFLMRLHRSTRWIAINLILMSIKYKIKIPRFVKSREPL